MSTNADRQLITGWGRAAGSAAHVMRVQSGEDLERFVSRAHDTPSAVLARGLGRSYGDAAQCAGGVLLDCTGLNRFIDADFDNGLLRVEAGASLDSILRHVVPKGWFVPVTPGTSHVTVGGAIAADVHGKNHHHDGTFGAHVEGLVLVTADGRTLCTSSIEDKVFWATVGGMGLTGAIAEADVRLHRIESAFMLVDTERACDLEACMAGLSDSDDRYRYSVAWVDCTARGHHLGRSVISHGDHARPSDLGPAQRRLPLKYEAGHVSNMVMDLPFNVVVPAAIRMGNELWYRKSLRRATSEIQSIASFFYPLDAISNWNRLYGPSGFTQYQFVVPHRSGDVVQKVIEHIHGSGITPSLGVLKRFGKADSAPLSFPIPGWTLALDLPLGARGIGAVLDQLDELIANAGGRVYLAKDGRLRPELMATMYPRLDEWLEVRTRVDPDGIFTSDLSRRLGIMDQQRTGS